MTMPGYQSQPAHHGRLNQSMQIIPGGAALINQGPSGNQMHMLDQSQHMFNAMGATALAPASFNNAMQSQQRFGPGFQSPDATSRGQFPQNHQKHSNSESRFDKEYAWKLEKKTQHAAVKVQLNEKYTQVNVMKAQKDQSEQKLNNLIGKKKLMQPDEFEREE